MLRFFKNSISCFLFWLIATAEPSGLLRAQLFPGMTGEPLADALRAAYTPTHLLNDTQVKDTLYAKIFATDDTVHCIYSGLGRYLPPGADPSQWLYGTGVEVGSMNLEHSWPQAKGAGEGTGGNTNMYHLYPSRSAINSDRGDLPYGEINDSQTTRWYYQDKEMASKPATNVDAYSEYINGMFEPRESVKGDIARGMFYFWTIYRADAEAADPTFFQGQLNTLCQWHEEDPVDAAEQLRNEKIAFYQGKPNPFILDCSLVQRAYCSQLDDCIPLAVDGIASQKFTLVFNPFTRQLMISGEPALTCEIHVVDVLGRSLHHEVLETGIPGDALQLPQGMYFGRAQSGYKIVSCPIFIP